MSEIWIEGTKSTPSVDVKVHSGVVYIFPELAAGDNLGRAKSSSPLDQNKKKKMQDHGVTLFRSPQGTPVSLARTGLRPSCRPIEEY